MANVYAATEDSKKLPREVPEQLANLRNAVAQLSINLKALDTRLAPIMPDPIPQPIVEGHGQIIDHGPFAMCGEYATESKTSVGREIEILTMMVNSFKDGVIAITAKVEV